ncbi:uncharacterized protein E6C27_scaffold404G00340 [Cucumis melo var. makuwa]|uniref:Uncharacterized protein n=1 Tax=Cucumis melo var. makuwa TaxID=1194695 RepID=A0A5A7U4H2_CUCMM|nr:uncharacterized protein E6C27_scaffold404G00340 [Cucumis melo var. makuwa]
MGDPTVLDTILRHLRSTCKYYTGFPKDLGPSRVIHFTSEREFVQLLHEGYPVVVAFTIRSNYSKHLDKVLEEAAVEFYPNVKFMRVECPKYPGFCISRQRKEYPFIEMFHSPKQASSQGKIADSNVTKYSVKVIPMPENSLLMLPSCSRLCFTCRAGNAHKKATGLSPLCAFAASAKPGEEGGRRL